MRAEILAVGSELLLGQITNTNAKFIASRLAEVGIDVYYQTVVGDNASRLKEAINIAETRADLIIFSGGLGPTKDDMTKETIANLLQVQLVQDDEALRSIQAFFDRTGRLMTDNNKKQALVLEGSTVLTNRFGMAPGMAIEKNQKIYILLPGPPHELEPMFEREAIPFLLGVTKNKKVIASKVLKFYGIGEAELEHRIQDLLEQQMNPTIAPLASASAVTLRLTAKASTTEQANELIAPIEAAIRSRVGEFIYGVDDDTLSSKVAELLLDQELTIAAAESLTAGLFMAELANEPGIGSSLSGGVVVYNEEEKVRQLGIDQSLLDEEGIVSSSCAAALAEHVRSKFTASIGIGLTGAAGPDAHDGSPVGDIWIGIAAKDTPTETFKLRLSGSRNSNRLGAAHFALYYTIRYMKKHYAKK